MKHSGWCGNHDDWVITDPGRRASANPLLGCGSWRRSHQTAPTSTTRKILSSTPEAKEAEDEDEDDSARRLSLMGAPVAFTVAAATTLLNDARKPSSATSMASACCGISTAEVRTMSAY